LTDLYGIACDGFESNRERLVVAKLLREYKHVFSCGDYEITLAGWTAAIWQLTRELDPETVII